MKVVSRTRSIFKFSSSSAESAGSPTLRLVSSATGRLAARRTIAGVVSVSLVSGPGAGGPILRSLSTHTWAVGLYIGSRRNITRLTRATIMAAITAMSSAPPNALAAIPASTPRTLPVFPSVITAPIVAKSHRRGKVDSGIFTRVRGIGILRSSYAGCCIPTPLRWRYRACRHPGMGKEHGTLLHGWMDMHSAACVQLAPKAPPRARRCRLWYDGDGEDYHRHHHLYERVAGFLRGALSRRYRRSLSSRSGHCRSPGTSGYRLQ